ncbi:MAG: DNA polymerase Y family protein [Streptosporangiaceae bacterium]
MSRVLVVWCPDWPLTAVGIEAAVPGAVLERQRIAACTAAARAAGVRRGQRQRDAQRHCPELVLTDRDPDAEGRLFETVAAAVAALTPRVEVLRPGVCAIPARGPARFYGGEEALRMLVQDAVVEAGHDCGVGVADGLFTAELAARAHSTCGVIVPVAGSAEFLAPFPLAVLDRPELADLLLRLGIRSLGEFAALPAPDVLARFGAEGVLAHRLSHGREPRPVAPRAAPHDLSAQQVFDEPAARSDQVVFAAKALADRLHDGLAQEGLTCVRLAVEVEFQDGTISERLWRHDGLLSSLAVAERVRWQLSGRQPAPGAQSAVWGGVSALVLTPDQVVPDTGSQQALWGPGSRGDRGALPEQVARAADRIQAILGHRSVTRPVIVGGRGPGEQVLRVPVGDLPLTERGDGPWPGRLPEPAPAVVPALPVPAAVLDGSGDPVMVSARCAVTAAPAYLDLPRGPRLAVTSWTGPWPCTERWWDPGQARRRARFQLTTPDGAYLVAIEAGRWSVEAVYD